MRGEIIVENRRGKRESHITGKKEEQRHSIFQKREMESI